MVSVCKIIRFPALLYPSSLQQSMDLVGMGWTSVEVDVEPSQPQLIDADTNGP